ncbi:insulinase family protein [bacterium]|nr:insulinase family protein [bacterium]
MLNFEYKKDVKKLSNAIPVYGIKDNSVPIIHFALVFREGVIDEPIDKKGVYSILSHMIFRGNRIFQKDYIDRELDSIGASLKMIASGDEISFLGNVSKENFNKFLQILNMLLFKEYEWDKDEFKIAKARALDQLVMIKEDDSYLSAAIFSYTLFNGKNYGLPSTGMKSSLKKITISDLDKYIKILREKPFFITISGDYDKDEFITMDRVFSQISFNETASENLISTKKIELYEPQGLELYYYHKPDRNQTQILLGQTSIPPIRKEIYILMLFNKYFGGDFTSLMAQEIREKRGWSYYAQSEITTYRHATTFSMEYAPFTEKTVESFKYFMELYKKELLTPISQKDLDFTIQKIVKRSYFKFSTLLRKMNALINSEIYGYPENFYQQFLEKIESLDPNFIQNVLSKLIYPEKQVVVMVGNMEPILEEFGNSNYFSKTVSMNDINWMLN